MAFFENQDWVWGVGLLVNGLFIALTIRRFGVDKYRQEVINTSPNDFKLGKFYNFIIGILIPIQAVFLIGWYFYQSVTQLDKDQWWNPFRMYSAGTMIFQWGLAMLLFFCFNKWLVNRSLQSHHEMNYETSQ